MVRFLIPMAAVLLLIALNLTPALALTHHSGEAEVSEGQASAPPSNPAPAATPSLSGPLPITFADIDGKWKGYWRARGGSGSITHFFFEAGGYVTVIDSDSAGTEYSNGTSFTIQGATLTVTWDGGFRVETYQLFRNSDALILKGTYTYKGSPWGKTELFRK